MQVKTRLFATATGQNNLGKNKFYARQLLDRVGVVLWQDTCRMFCPIVIVQFITVLSSTWYTYVWNFCLQGITVFVYHHAVLLYFSITECGSPNPCMEKPPCSSRVTFHTGGVDVYNMFWVIDFFEEVIGISCLMVFTVLLEMSFPKIAFYCHFFPSG